MWTLVFIVFISGEPKVSFTKHPTVGACEVARGEALSKVFKTRKDYPTVTVCVNTGGKDGKTNR